MKTSLSDPLVIAQVSPVGAAGVIGLTLCPGKKDPARRQLRRFGAMA
jgi:hypothetical protein